MQRNRYFILCFRYFIPVDDVIIGFELHSSEAPPKFKPILSWLENNYIGKFKPNSRTSRVVPRYPMLTTKLKYGMVLVEQTLKKNLTCVKCVDLIRREQNFTENNWTKSILGENECRK